MSIEIVGTLSFRSRKERCFTNKKKCKLEKVRICFWLKQGALHENCKRLKFGLHLFSSEKVELYTKACCRWWGTVNLLIWSWVSISFDFMIWPNWTETCFAFSKTYLKRNERFPHAATMDWCKVKSTSLAIAIISTTFKLDKTLVKHWICSSTTTDLYQWIMRRKSRCVAPWFKTLFF